MKLFVLALLIAIVLGGLAGTWLVRDPGYVLISYADTVVETSLWVAVMLFIAAYVLLAAVTFLLRKIIQSQSRVTGWRSGRKLKAARSQTVRGLLVMSERRWPQASKLLLGAIDEVETPFINYLGAARAANEMGQYDERDAYLKSAEEATPGAKFAVALTQAEFNIREGRHEQALAALLELRKRAPKHAAVLSMLAQCYEALGDTAVLFELMGDLRKQQVLPAAELTRIEHNVWQARLQSDESASLLWKKLPKALRADVPLIRMWAEYLNTQGRVDDAEMVIRQAMSLQFDGDLAQDYGEIRSSNVAKQLTTAQSWSKAHANDAQLALTLGRLCLLNEKFEQAREHFEASLRLAPTDIVYGELGRLCIALGDERRGTEYLLHTLSHLDELPQPAEPLIHQASAS